jgi:hypothetical protein
LVLGGRFSAVDGTGVCSQVTSLPGTMSRHLESCSTQNGGAGADTAGQQYFCAALELARSLHRP